MIVFLRNDGIDMLLFSFLMVFFVISASWCYCYVGCLFVDGFVWAVVCGWYELCSGLVY
jgi:hypothetical protein